MSLTYQTFISTAELSERIARGEPTAVFDTRFSLADTEYGRRSYAAGHIPTAQYAHLDEDLSGPVVPGKSGRHPLPDPGVFAARLGNWGVHSGLQVVVYDDDNGGIAARLWWMLRWLGHDQAAVLDGGWRAWVRAGGPVETRFQPAQSSEFKPNIRPELFRSGSEVMSMRSAQQTRLLDARTADRFAGQNETIDPVAGHIPGAVSASYKDTINEDGTTRSPEALQAWFRSKLADFQPEQAVFYCGSGVTACRGVLAMEYAGLPGSSVYEGSWSEWIRISDQVATGNR